MRLIITGGLGFIGSNFIRYILSKYLDYKIINLDVKTYAGNLENLKDIENNLNYKFVKGDICNAYLVDSLVKNCDIVINFAAESHVDRSITGPAEFIKTNVVGTQVLLDACVKYGKRIHHISTDEVFGSLPLIGNEKFDEGSLYAPSSPYSASKAASDHLVRAYVKTYGLPATISNCSNNYGPYQNTEKFIPLMITQALNNKKLPVYGNGRNIRDWIHVYDHCTAIDLIIHNGIVGETYLVGGNSEESNINVAKKIIKILGKSENLINFVTDRKGHDLKYAINSSKIEEKLGWNRLYDFETGLKQTVDWYINNKDWYCKQ